MISVDSRLLVHIGMHSVTDLDSDRHTGMGLRELSIGRLSAGFVNRFLCVLILIQASTYLVGKDDIVAVLTVNVIVSRMCTHRTNEVLM